MNDRQREVALFRYSLIREAADPELGHAERGELVRELASRDHAGPGGRRALLATQGDLDSGAAATCHGDPPMLVDNTGQTPSHREIPDHPRFLRESIFRDTRATMTSVRSAMRRGASERQAGIAPPTWWSTPSTRWAVLWYVLS
jgi:hypothetical protein